MGDIQQQVAERAARYAGANGPPVTPEVAPATITPAAAALAAAEIALISHGAVRVTPDMAAAPRSHA